MMQVNDFIAQLNKAVNSKTLYVSGAWGIELRSDNPRVTTLYNKYKRNREHWAEIQAVMDKGYFGDDCVCLIKSMFWGWDGKYPTSGGAGGAIYCSNGVPDCTENAMIEMCYDLSTNFTNICVGEAVWMNGHIGVYVGNGLCIECTPAWDNCVQITGLGNIGKSYNGKTRSWTKHGKFPWLDYSGNNITKTVTENKTENIGIDVSRYQKGLNIFDAQVQGFNHIIIKAGGADSGYYKDSQFENFYQQANSNRDYWKIGAYYFGCAFSEDDAKKEANYFLQYLQGKDITKVYYDVEGKMLNQGYTHLTKIIQTFCEEMYAAGYECGIYTSESQFNSRFDDTKLSKYPHWVARYSTIQPKLNSGNQIEMWQYGGSVNYIRSPKIGNFTVDQNQIWIEWNTKKKETSVTSQDLLMLSDIELAYMVMDDVFGKGLERKNKLGSRYAAVQKEVNRIYKERENERVVKTIDQLANEVLADMWGKDPMRAIKLRAAGYDARAVQNRVNEICEMRKQKHKTYIVTKEDSKRGLSGIAKRYNTTWQKLAEANNLPNPNLIYVGQELIIA